MNIHELVKDTFINCEINSLLSRQEIIDKVVLKHNCNPSSIIPSDYCYNRTNNGILNKNLIRLFEYESRSVYRYLGEHYSYSGLLIHKPKNGTENVVGEWINGHLNLRYK